LWAVSIICTDKTGTLTQNAMTIEWILTHPNNFYTVTWNGRETTGEIIHDNIQPDVYGQEKHTIDELVKYCTLSNQWNLTKNESWGFDLIWDPTEIALHVLWKKLWHTKDSLAKEYNIIFDLPFNSEKKARATLIEHQSERFIIIIGAAENILSESIIEKNDKHLRSECIEHHSSSGKRVLAIAHKKVDSTQQDIIIDDIEWFSFYGIVIIHDPLRIEVPNAIKECHNAWIRVIMMTGDHKNTARYIWYSLWIVNDNYPNVYTENELQDCTDAEILEKTMHCNIFARCTPQRKLQILSLLQSHGEIVAMTWDGVNDAPALKKADVGIAMWIMWTDVAREASQIILADDNFTTIVSAIKQWRIIYNNVKKSSLLALNRVLAWMWSLIAILLWSDKIPFIASQLLWLNLVTETITWIGIAFEKEEGNEMSMKPRQKNASFITPQDIINLLVNAITMIILIVGSYIVVYTHTKDIVLTTTMAFLLLYFCQFTNLYNFRSFSHSVFTIWFFSNKIIVIGTIVSFILQLIALLRTPLSRVLSFTWVWTQNLMIIFVISWIVLIVWELYKYLQRKNII
jgi:Ca2+-transporting ATPase